MSNKKRINSRINVLKKKSINFELLTAKKLPLLLFDLSEAANVMAGNFKNLKASFEVVLDSKLWSRKTFPAGGWTPPSKINLLFPERGQEFISDKFGNRKEINLEKSWTKYFSERNKVKMPFLQYLLNEIESKNYVNPGKTQSGAAEKFLK